MRRAQYGLAVLLAGSLTAPLAAQPAEASASESAELARLIAQLGSENYDERETAQKAIEAMGFEAFDALSAAEVGEDPEVAARARYLVKRMQVEWASQQDSADVRRILGGYSQGDDRARRVAIDALAQLPSGEGLPALARLVRFESAPLRSKQAGMRGVEALQKMKTVEPDVAEAIGRTLGPSTRAGAEWLHAALLHAQDPAAGMNAWTKVVADEQETNRTFPQRSHVELIRQMLRVQVDWLLELDRRDEAEAGMKRLIALDLGTSHSLRALVKWFAERQAWSMLDEVERQYGHRVSRDPVLIYHFAQARERQGDAAKATELAAKALAIGAGDSLRHYEVGRELHRIGMRRYALDEFQEVVKLDPPESLGSLSARILIAEGLYDRGDNLAAAKMLQEGLDAIANSKETERNAQTLMRDPPSMRARLLYFEAAEAAKTSAEEQLKKLLAALDADDTDLDVLIALHRHPGLQGAERERVTRLIAAAAEVQRMAIREAGRDPIPHNQLAWLLANTDGDPKEALNCSQKSLELMPNDPGYLDTLAHCYFNAGEIDRAIAVEEQACAGDPESGLLARALERFRAAKK